MGRHLDRAVLGLIDERIGRRLGRRGSRRRGRNGRGRWRCRRNGRISGFIAAGAQREQRGEHNERYERLSHDGTLSPLGIAETAQRMSLLLSMKIILNDIPYYRESSEDEPWLFDRYSAWTIDCPRTAWPHAPTAAGSTPGCMGPTRPGRANEPARRARREAPSIRGTRTTAPHAKRSLSRPVAR